MNKFLIPAAAVLLGSAAHAGCGDITLGVFSWQSAEAYPEIKTLADAAAHPELFPAPEDPSKGGVLLGPQG